MRPRSSRRVPSVPRTSRLLIAVLRLTLGTWLRWRFRITVAQDDRVRALRPPYVVLPNHVNFWDPFLVGIAQPHSLHFVAADGNFRSTLMRILLPRAGAVPKAKARNDLESIRTLQSLIIARKSIAIFAEGQRTWDGVGRALLPGIEKLVRLLDAPVLAVRLRGAYLATPRWSRTLRRGPVTIEKEILLTREDLGRLSREEIARRIGEAIHVDEPAWQRETGRLYHSRRRAEHVEWALFHCPACGADGTLRSSGNEFRCRACGEEHWIAPSGRLYLRDPSRGFCPPRLPDLHSWDSYQHEVLRTRIFAAVGDRSTGILRVERCLYLRGYRSRALHRRGHVSLRIDWDRVVVGPDEFEVPITEISGLHVQYIEQVEFYAFGRLHVFRILEPHDSAYRIEQTIQELYQITNN